MKGRKIVDGGYLAWQGIAGDKLMVTDSETHLLPVLTCQRTFPFYPRMDDSTEQSQSSQSKFFLFLSFYFF